MAKNIRWQIPFVSDIDKTKYRIDIYDEGTFTPVQLKSGPTPFVTNEKNDSNFFAPVRSQTGTIQVCTAIPGGGTLSLNDILPANNIARPVRLVSISGSTETIEWQGFLSCEAYTQDYIGIPQNLDIPVISVLEAMDSVEVELDENMAFARMLAHTVYAMKEIETESGMTLWSNVYISNYIRNALEVFVYSNTYFNEDENLSGDNIVVEVHSISCKKILEKVAKFFGAYWREKGQNIYLCVSGNSQPLMAMGYSSLYQWYVTEHGTAPTTGGTYNQVTSAMSSLDWRGTNHKRSVTQGMRRVSVSAKLEDFKLDMTLPECPVNDLVENPDARQTTWGEVYANTNDTFYNLAAHKCMKMQLKNGGDSSNYYLFINSVTAQSASHYVDTIYWATDGLRTNMAAIQAKTFSGTIDRYATSYMAWMRDDDELVSGLVVTAIPHYIRQGYQQEIQMVFGSYSMSNSNYIYMTKSPLFLNVSSGTLTLEATFCYVSANRQTYYVDKDNDPFGTWNHQPGIYMAVKIGQKWLKKTGNVFSWSNSFTTFVGQFDRTGKMSYEIPIEEALIGGASIYLFPICEGDIDTSNETVMSMFFTQLDLTYKREDTELRTDRNSNDYITDTGNSFSDELNFDVEFASDANNLKQATLLWSDDTHTVRLLTLGGLSVRPEVDLLDRLAAYYGAARQRLELEVAHPTAAPLPLLRLNGINDGKVYLPLSESRDWKADSCKLTCFETPN